MDNNEKKRFCGLKQIEAENLYKLQCIKQQNNNFFELCKRGMFGSDLILFGYKNLKK